MYFLMPGAHGKHFFKNLGVSGAFSHFCLKGAPKTLEIHVFAERTQSWLQFAEGAIKYDRQPLDAEELYEALTDMAEEAQ